MKANTKVPTYIAAFFLVCLIYPLVSANLALAGAIPVPLPGCCTTESDGGQCVACPEGETCLTSEDFCEAQDGFFSNGGCFEDSGEVTCGDFEAADGCCVVEPGSCIDDIDFDTCFFEVSSSTELWVSNTSCSEVPQCTPTRNIPTMSNWGLIALAAVIVLVGIWGITRKKSQA